MLNFEAFFPCPSNITGLLILPWQVLSCLTFCLWSRKITPHWPIKSSVILLPFLLLWLCTWCRHELTILWVRFNPFQRKKKKHSLIFGLSLWIVAGQNTSQTFSSMVTEIICLLKDANICLLKDALQGTGTNISSLSWRRVKCPRPVLSQGS